MDNLEKLIEQYRRELVEFSKSCPAEAENEACGGEQNSEETDEAEAVTEQTPPEADTHNEENEAPSESHTPVPRFDTYDDFIKANPQSGTMRVQVYAAGQAFPISNAEVTVFLELARKRNVIFEGLTDVNGVIDGIILPAPAKEKSQSPSDAPALPYASYSLSVEHPEFADAVFYDIPVFSGIRSIQGVELVPLLSGGGEPAAAETDEGDSFSRVKGADYPWQLP